MLWHVAAFPGSNQAPICILLRTFWFSKMGNCSSTGVSSDASELQVAASARHPSLSGLPMRPLAFFRV
eukprot:s410_g11.t1